MSENATAETLNLTKKGMETREKLLRAAEKVFGKKVIMKLPSSTLLRKQALARVPFIITFNQKRKSLMH